MSDPTLTALRALADEVGERAAPPPFDEVTARAGRRRRIRTSLVAAAAVLVRGRRRARRCGPARPDPAPSPAPPATTGSLPAAVTELVGHRDRRAVRDGRWARRVARGDLARPRAAGADVRAGRPGRRRRRHRTAARRAVRPDGRSRRLGRVARRAAGVLRRGRTARVADLPVESTQARPRAGDWAVPHRGRPAAVAVAHRPARAPRRWRAPRRSSWSRTRARSSPTSPARRSSRPRRGRRSCSPRAPAAWSLAAYGGDIAAVALGDDPGRLDPDPGARGLPRHRRDLAASHRDQVGRHHLARRHPCGNDADDRRPGRLHPGRQVRPGVVTETPSLTGLTLAGDRIAALQLRRRPRSPVVRRRRPHLGTGHPARPLSAGAVGRRAAGGTACNVGSGAECEGARNPNAVARGSQWARPSRLDPRAVLRRPVACQLRAPGAPCPAP